MSCGIHSLKSLSNNRLMINFPLRNMCTTPVHTPLLLIYPSSVHMFCVSILYDRIYRLKSLSNDRFLRNISKTNICATPVSTTTASRLVRITTVLLVAHMLWKLQFKVAFERQIFEKLLRHKYVYNSWLYYYCFSFLVKITTSLLTPHMLCVLILYQ